jgi:arsenical pump membrane protein
MKLTAAIALHLVVLVALWWRPKRFGVGTIAIIGALVPLLLGLVSWNDPILSQWMFRDTVLVLVIVILLVHLLQTMGLFDWLAVKILSRVRQLRVLFFTSIVAVSLAALLFTDNGAIVLLTPLLAALSRIGKWPSTTTLAFAISWLIMAAIASAIAPFSHPVSRYTLQTFRIDTGEYILVMFPIVMVAAIVATFVLWWSFYQQIPPRRIFPLSPREIPSQPTSPFSFSSLRKTPWQVLLFAWGMYLAGIGLGNAGLEIGLQKAIAGLNNWGVAIVSWGTGFLAAIVSSLSNHLPAIVVQTNAIRDMEAIAPTSAGMTALQATAIYATILGCTIGAKLVPIGSLSTLFWLHYLSQAGIRITWAQHTRLCLPIVLPTLFVALLILLLWVPWLFDIQMPTV